jgi:hypothetical protein
MRFVGQAGGAVAILGLLGGSCTIIDTQEREPVDLETFALPGEGGCFGVALLDATLAWNDSDREVTVTGRDGVELRVLWPPGFTGNRVDGGIEIVSAEGETVAVTGQTYSEVGICRIADGLVLVGSRNDFVP